MFGKIGLPELIFLLAIVVILFGATRLPQLGRGIGEGIRNFKKGMKGAEEPDPLDERPGVDGVSRR